MRSNRGRDSKLELAVRRLHAAGRRYRVDYKLKSDLRTRADIVFTRARVAVFMDGCFWHGCPGHATSPKTNRTYWQTRSARNVLRDRETGQALKIGGWTVLRYWEHESPDGVASGIVNLVRRILHND